MRSLSVHRDLPRAVVLDAAANDGRLGFCRVKTVRDEALQTMRRLGLTTIFGNPGSTEISFLTDLPDDIRFVLGLHEGSVVGIAAGYAIARGEPAFVNLHTAAGLGNAINAIANARDCRAPLVVVVGQQDRRQIAHEPFLTGRQLERLAGEYPVWTNFPVRAQDVPGAIARAYNEAIAGAGPAIVVVPMGDWSEPADELAAGSPARVLRSASVASEQVDELAALVAAARSPALVVGMCDTREQWAAIIALAERLRCPVWQEPFVRRAGFPQDHRLFAGHLSWRRGSMRRTLSAYDTVVAIGAGAFRLYLFDEPTAVVAPGTRVAVITEHQAEAHRSHCELALVGSVASACSALADALPQRDGDAPEPMRRPPAPSRPEPGAPLTPGHVFAGLARAAPRRRGRDRGDALEPARALPADPDPGAARVRQHRQRRTRVRDLGRNRAADGSARAAGSGVARRRVFDLRDPGGVDRRPVRGRGAAGGARQRRLRDHGQARP